MIRVGRHANVGVVSTVMAGMLAVSAVSAGAAGAADEASKAEPPRPVRFETCATPEYPKADIRAGHTGTTTLRFLVSADGTVQDSQVAKSSGYESLDEAARSAIAKCRFAPAADPAAAARWMPVQYVWTLEGPETAVPMSPEAREQAFLWGARVLSRYGYKLGMPASGAPAPVLDRYLAALDPEHVLFTQADIARLD